MNEVAGPSLFPERSPVELVVNIFLFALPLIVVVTVVILVFIKFGKARPSK